MTCGHLCSHLVPSNSCPFAQDQDTIPGTPHIHALTPKFTNTHTNTSLISLPFSLDPYGFLSSKPVSLPPPKTSLKAYLSPPLSICSVFHKENPLSSYLAHRVPLSGFCLFQSLIVCWPIHIHIYLKNWHPLLERKLSKARNSGWMARISAPKTTSHGTSSN